MSRTLKYALLVDDLIYRTPGTVITASAEDPAYPVSNWLLTTDTGIEPERPSKLTTATGFWIFDFLTAVNIAAVGLLFTNFDAGLVCTVKWNSSNSWGAPAGSTTIIIPAVPSDLWTISPWTLIPGSPTFRYWRIEVALSGSPNAQLLQLGRPLFLGALRTLPRDIQHEEQSPFEIEETHELLPSNYTALKVEKPIPLIERIRAMVNAKIGVTDTEVPTLVDIRRACNGRQLQFYVVPDTNVNDIWCVRLENITGVQQFITNNWKIYPFAFREVSRGIPWP